MDKVDQASKGLVASDEQDRSMTVALELSRVSSSTPLRSQGYGGASYQTQGSEPNNSQHGMAIHGDGIARIMAVLDGMKAGMQLMNTEIQSIKQGQESLCEQLAGLKLGVPMVRGTRLPAAVRSDQVET